MNRLVVGDKNCSFRGVVSCFNNAPSIAVVKEEWKLLSRGLNTSKLKERQLEDDLILRHKNVLDVVEEILEAWRMTASSEAKLTSLLDVLEHTCRWNDISEAIWATYYNQLENDTTWQDLDTRSQTKCLNHIVEFFGHKETFDKCLERVSPLEREKTLNTLTPSLLQQLLGDNVIVLAQNNIPSTPPYYIPRLLTRRTRLKPEIFEDACPDVFVFENISLRELHDVARAHHVDRSSTQIRRLTVRFILAEFEEDFEQIAKIAKNTPVHLLQKRDGNFFWRKSRGSLHIIQEYIHPQQEVVTEKDFIGNLPADDSICFADNPGMGKSLLMANLCIQKSTLSNSGALLYIEFPKLLTLFDKSKTDFAASDALNVVVKMLCTNDLGKRILLELIRLKKLKVDLFLDGFDEIPEFNISLAKAVTSVFVHEPSYFQVYCSTRLHRREKMERIVGALSYTISPFNTCNQIDFLCKFWFHQYKVETTSTLIEFAKHVVKSVKAKLETDGANIIGIPLQCNLLAEIFSIDAMKHSHQGKSTKLGIYVEPLSICDMYQQLEEKRMSNFSKEKAGSLIFHHSLIAVSSIFPNVVIPQSLLESAVKDVDKSDIHRLGYMHNNKPLGIAEFCFAHRTFSEYFLARLVVNVMLGLLHVPTEFSEALLSECLKSSKANKNVRMNTIDFQISKVLEILETCKDAENIKLDWKTIAEKLGLDSRSIAEAYSILNQIDKDCNKMPSLPNKWFFCHPLMTVLVKWTNKLVSTPRLVRLSQALKSSGYVDAAESIESELNNWRYPHTFVHANVAFFVEGLLSASNAKFDIEPKSDFSSCPSITPEIGLFLSALYHNFGSIFQLTAYKLTELGEKRFLNQKDCCVLLYHAVRHSNVDLVIKTAQLLEQFQAETLCNELFYMDTPLHLAARRGDYMVFKCVQNHVNYEMENPESLLQNCVMLSYNEADDIVSQKLEIIEDVVSMHGFKLTGKDLKSSFNADSPYLIHFKLAKHILELGVNPYFFNQSGYTIAHFAAENYTAAEFIEISELLISKGFSDIFELTTSFDVTPLESALSRLKLPPTALKMIHEDLQTLTAKQLLFAIDGFQDKETLEVILANCLDEVLETTNVIHSAAKSGNIEAIELLASVGCNVNKRLKNGFTPLHEVIVNGGRNIHIVTETLIASNIVESAVDENGRTALWHAKRGKDRWRIEPRTITLLHEAQRKNILEYKLTAHINKHASFLENCAKAGVPADMDTKIIKNINATDKAGRTVCHWACINESIEALKYFIEIGADINAEDQTRKRPLHYLSNVKLEFVGLVDLMVKNGGNINATNSAGINVVLQCAKGGRSLREVQHLIDVGGNWRATTVDGVKVLHMAASEGHCELVKYFLSLGSNPQDRTSDAKVPLHFLAYANQGFEKTLKILLKNGAEINARDSKGYNLLLSCVSEKRSLEYIAQVVKLGGDWKVKTVDGKSVVHLAAQSGHYKALEFFLELGSDLHAHTVDGKLPIHFVAFAKQNFKKTLQVLAEHGADLNAMDAEGYNLILRCVLEDRSLEEIRFLVELKGNWKAKTKLCESVLHLASSKGNVEILKCFLSLGSSVQEKTLNGRLPLHYLVYAKEQFKEAAHILLDKGVDINATDDRGYNLVLLSAMEGRKAELKTLIDLGAKWDAKTLSGCGVLHLAAQEGHFAVLKFFVDLGADLSEQTMDYRVPIHFLAFSKHGFENCLQFMVESGANINDVDDEGYNLILYLVAQGRSVQQMRYAISLGGTWSTKLHNGCGVLHLAVQNGNYEAAKFFLELGLSPHDETLDSRLPIHFACFAKTHFQETVQILMEGGADINAVDDVGYNLVLYCVSCRRSHADLKYLINFGGNWEAKTTDGRSVLHLAAFNGQLETLKMFLELGADTNLSNVDGFSPILFATFAEENFLEAVALLQGAGGSINCKNQTGQTIVMLAIQNGKTSEDLEMLVNCGADWKSTDNEGTSPLHYAAQYGNYEALTYILSLNVDVNLKNNYGRTPLLLLAHAETNFHACLNVLLENGADVNAVDVNGENLVHKCALERSNSNEIEMVLESGGNWRSTNAFGDNVLALAVKGGNPEIVKLFLTLGADVNARNFAEKTPLHSLVHVNNNTFVDCLSTMLDHGGDLNAVDEEGNSLLLIAAAVTELSIENLNCIVTNGGNLELRNKKGESVLHLAVKAGNFHTLNYFLMKQVFVECRDQFGRTPLLAFEHTKVNKKEVLLTLFKYKADINACASDGRSLFQVLIDKENTDSLVVLNKVLAEVL